MRPEVTVTAAIIIGLLFMASALGSAEILDGTCVEVLGGDRLVIESNGARLTVQLWGVDAPELDQPWGEESRAKLEELVLNRQLQFRERSRSDALVVAQVRVEGRDLASQMAEMGMVWLADSGGTSESYATTIIVARAAAQGMWEDGEENLVHPALYLKEKSKPTPTPTPTPIPQTISEIASNYEIESSGTAEDGSVAISNTSIRPGRFNLPDSEYAQCVVPKVREIQSIVDSIKRLTKNLSLPVSDKGRDKLSSDRYDVKRLTREVEKCGRLGDSYRGEYRLEQAMELYRTAVAEIRHDPKTGWLLFGKADEKLEEARRAFSDEEAERQLQSAESHSKRDPWDRR
jgi:endonuclease YncB( thermonuclease family)